MRSQSANSNLSDPPLTFDVRPHDQVLSGDVDYLRRRLTILALFLSGMIFLIFPVKYILITMGSAIDTESEYAVYYRIGLIGISLLVVAAIQFLKISAAGIKTIAVSYKLTISYLLACMEFLFTYTDPHLGPGISQVCVWVILFPIFIHPSFVSNVISSAVSGLLVPAAYFSLTKYCDYPTIPSNELVAFFVPTFMICFSSVVPTTILIRAAKALNKARSMGAYQLKGKIGSGGMGEVWKARHEMLLRNVAIKIIKTGRHTHLNTEARKNIGKRFKREAQAIASLKSPHTIEIYDVGACPNNMSFYYVMEHLEGYDLKVLVDKFGPISTSRAIFILRQVTHSLRNAHQNQLVHRDVKPANIVACPYGADYDFVKVLDFGLVKLLDQSVDSQLTQEGVSSGTPAFISPEMAIGSSEVGQLTDIYALGCVAYWLVTGTLVFEAENSIQMAVKHVQQKPDLPSSRTEIEIPEAFEQLIMKCLEKEPAKRFQSMQDLCDALVECDPGDWNQKKAKKWWDLHQRVSTISPGDEEILEKAV